jgi:chromosome segregation ATPase
LKERFEALCQENGVLKRAVVIQHEMLKEGEEKEKELKQFKEMVEHYQEKVRMLEVNNYALSVHLNQALHGNSPGGRCNPDVY